MLQQQDDADWHRVRSEVRPAVCDVHARGIGLRRLQLILCPSFEDGQAWEIRQLDAEWRLFHSRVVEPWPNVQLVGYDTIPIDPAALSSFFDRVVALSLPITPCASVAGGADGKIHQLAVFDMFSACRFQWWTVSPPQWKPLVDLASEMLVAFTSPAWTSG